jgi:hypothetical protein
MYLSVFVGRVLPVLAVFMTLTSGNVNAQVQTFEINRTDLAINYVIDGVSDPDLVLVRGKTYVFQLSTPGHPFCIKTAPTRGDVSDRFDSGVTNNCIATGTLTFVVPLNAPDLLYYICSLHISMTGQIQIIDDLPLFEDGFES